MNWKNLDRIVILGHRGCGENNQEIPENTLESFKQALLKGLDGIEIDVRLTKDGKVVVLHDADTERVLKSKLEVKKADYSDLKHLKFKDRQMIPLLDQVYEILPKDKLINVEIKDPDASEEAFKIAKNFDALERTLFSSFKVESLERLRKISKEAILGLLIENESIIAMLPELIQKLNLYSLNVPIEAKKVLGEKRFIYYLRTFRTEFPIKIVLWTVNNPEDLYHLKGLYDAVITDDYEKVKGAVRGLKVR